MFSILSPSKPINFEPRFILKLPQNSILCSATHYQNARKIQWKTRREREREITSGDVAGRRGRERKRGGGRNERERGKREKFRLQMVEEPKKEEEKEEPLVLLDIGKTTSFWLVKKICSVDPNDRSSGNKNDTSFPSSPNDKSSDTYERHVVRSPARATVRATPDDTPFALRR